MSTTPRRAGSASHWGSTPPLTSSSAGKIGLFTAGGYGDMRRLLRLRTDGTTGGEPINGGLFTTPNTAGASFAGQAHITMSTDGKSVYVTGLGRSTHQGRNRDLRSEK